MTGYSSALKHALVAAGLILGPVATAHPAPVDLFSYGTAGTPPNGHQWSLDVSVTGDQAIFTFSKTKAGQGYGLTDIYFETGLESLLGSVLSNPPVVSSPVNTNQIDVAFMSGTGSFGDPDEDPLVPGAANPWAGNLVHFISFETTMPQGSSGKTKTVSAQDNSLDRGGEFLTITWDYAGTENDLIAALLDGSGNSRIAVRVNQNQGNGVCPDNSCGLSTVNPIPLPPAAWLLGSSLVGMVIVSRRKSKSSS